MAVAALCLSVGAVLSAAVAAGVSTIFFPMTGARIDEAAGKALFGNRCSGCHAVASGQAGGLGPSLANIGVEAHARKAGASAEEYVLESVLYPDAYREPSAEGQMPRGTTQGASEKDVRNLVAYVVGLSAKPDYGTLLDLSIDAPAAEPEREVQASLPEIQHGYELFSRSLGCVGCHSILGEPGGSLRAPSLTKASQLPTDYILSSIRHPSEYVSKNYRRVSVTLNDGRVVDGQLMRERSDGIDVLVESAQGRLEKLEFTMLEIREMAIDPRSPMPAYDLSPDDERALISFLKFLSAST